MHIFLMLLWKGDYLIRNFQATDILRFIIDGKSLGPDWAHTWEKLTLPQRITIAPTKIASRIILQGEKEPCSVLLDGYRLKALVSARVRSGPTAWEIHCLNLPNNIPTEAYNLLVSICKLASSRGGHRVFLRVPVQSRIINLAREVGFIELFVETSYTKNGSKPFSIMDNPLRAVSERDYVTIYDIYNETVPAKIKPSYALTFNEWKDAGEPIDGNVEEVVYDVGGNIKAWARITKDKYFVNRLDFMINPGEEYSVWETVVGWATSRDDNLDPYFVLVPDYEQTLKWTLERIGFVPGNSYQFMSIPLAVNAEEPTLILAGA